MEKVKIESIVVITKDGQTVEIPYRELKIFKDGFVYFSETEDDLFIPIVQRSDENNNESW